MGYKGKKVNQPFIKIDSSSNVVYEKIIATEGQTLFNTTNTYEVNANKIKVYIGGVPQFPGDNFTETSKNSITLPEGITAGMEVRIEILQ